MNHFYYIVAVVKSFQKVYEIEARLPLFKACVLDLVELACLLAHLVVLEPLAVQVPHDVSQWSVAIVVSYQENIPLRIVYYLP